MFFKIFCVFDSKAEAFLQPFFSVNRAVALRSFTQACQDGQSDFHRFAGDYSLFEIGDWSSEKGELVMYEAKVNLGLASQYLNVEES